MTLKISKSLMRWNLVMKIYNDFVSNGLLEDRREYDVEEYMRSYPSLTAQEATELDRMVQRNFEPDCRCMALDCHEAATNRTNSKKLNIFVDLCQDHFDSWKDS